MFPEDATTMLRKEVILIIYAPFPQNEFSFLSDQEEKKKTKHTHKMQ